MNPAKEQKQMGHRSWNDRWALAAGIGLLLAGCKQDAAMVASNCEKTHSCEQVQEPLQKIDSVDILLVVDTSGSVSEEGEELRAELPRLLNAIVNGSDEDGSFPPVSSVHVAVATSDMGADQLDSIDQCQGLGDDGVFVRPGQNELSCDVSYPGYLAYDGEAAAIATVDTVSCVPLTGYDGCGFEMPLEAGLKALWPASDMRLSFLSGDGHGEDDNAGFLRPDSLLVVVVVTDEDDCSASDRHIFTPVDFLEPGDPLAEQPINLRCSENPNSLYAPERYIQGFRTLRPDNENVVFAVIAGVPADLVEARGEYDFTSPESIDAYYAAVLDDERMQKVVDPQSMNMGGGNLQPSCMREVMADVDRDGTTEPTTAKAYPPRRLLEVAHGFGAQGVVGSICDDFGSSTGMIIRAIGERLTEAANTPDAGMSGGD
jgi:hypothetical protein